MPDIFVAEHKTKKEPALKKHAILENNEERSVKPHPIINSPEKKQIDVHMFSSFCKNPGDILFQNQDKDEQVLLFVRKAFITNFKWILISVLLSVLPFAFPLIQVFFPSSSIHLSAGFYLILLAFYYLIVATYVYVNFITWYFNISLITNKKVVDIDFSGVVYKNVASTTLSLVQDVNYSQVGVIRTFFNYGDVLVQTAGTMENFDFNAVPQPENVVHLIGGLIGKRK